MLAGPIFDIVASMAEIDPEIDRIIEERVEDPRMRHLLRDILDWEAKKLHQTRRWGKKEALDRMIESYTQDTK